VARRFATGRLEAVEGVASALARALDLDGGRGVVVVTGSFYTTGEAKEILTGPGILSRLRE
jgi:folylpolyglutamate synthase/dihydropteroate synthase